MCEYSTLCYFNCTKTEKDIPYQTLRRLLGIASLSSLLGTTEVFIAEETRISALLSHAMSWQWDMDGESRCSEPLHVLSQLECRNGPVRQTSFRKMSSLVSLIFQLQLLLLFFIPVQSSGHALSRVCELKCKNCPQLQFCTGEVVKDHCGCCQMCSSDLYQPHVRLTPLPNKNNACEKVKCPKFKVCMINMQGLPLCSCPSVYMCRRRRREVCGSDSVTYKSRCHMRVAACNSDKKIRVATKGPCEMQDLSAQSSLSHNTRNKKKKFKTKKKKKRNKRRQRKRSKKRRRIARISREYLRF